MTHSVIVEMRPRLQVCNVFLVAKECLSRKESVKINVKVTGVEVIWLSDRGESIQTINLQNYKLKPLSLSGLQVQNNSISFRIQTEPQNNITGSVKSEILPFNQSSDMVKKECFTPAAPCIPVDKSSVISCKCCGEVLSNRISFKRVLPLPSGSLDISEWFCHKHSDSSMPQFSFVPKETECFYGPCYILLSSSLINLNTGQVLICCRCKSWLGTRVDSSTKLWYCTVSFGSNTNSTPLEDFKFVVSKAVEDAFTMTCRVIVETKISTDVTQFLLLWVLDKDLDVLVSYDGTGNNVNNSKQSTKECILKPKKTMKLLYMYNKDVNDMVKSWQKDINVQCIEIAKQMFTDGLDYLVRGTEYIPDPHKITNNFFVSYLGL